MPCNVLIVDDSATMRQMIKRALTIAGLDVGEVYEASNGIEAFAQLAQHEIGVVLLDINMPVMNGVQFLGRLRDDQRLRDVSVVITSTEGSETRVAQLRERGIRGYLRKPFYPEQLRDALAPMVGFGRGAAVAFERGSETSF
jgi:two-component system chemotaxis response regulator CheY